MKWLRTLLSKVSAYRSLTSTVPNSGLPSVTSSSQTIETSPPIPAPIEPLPPAPNEIGAVTNHFSQLLPALVGSIIAVLIAALSKDFPQRVVLGPVHCGHIVTALGVVAGFLFYDGIQKSYLAQSQNLTAMGTEARKEIFHGIDPFNYYDNKLWRGIIDGHMSKARLFSRKAIWRLEIGTLLLFYSIAMVLYAYFFWLGLSALILVTVYSFIDIKKIVTEIRAERMARDLASKSQSRA